MNPFGNEEVIAEENVEEAKKVVKAFKEDFIHVPIYIGGNNSMSVLLPSYMSCSIDHKENWLIGNTFDTKNIPQKLSSNNRINPTTFEIDEIICCIKSRDEIHDLSGINLIEFTNESIIFGTMSGYLKCIDINSIKDQPRNDSAKYKFQQSITAICTTVSPDYWVIAASTNIYMYNRNSKELLKVNKYYGLILNIWKTNIGHIFITGGGDVVKVKIIKKEFYNVFITQLATSILQADVIDVARPKILRPGVLVAITCCQYLAIYEISPLEKCYRSCLIKILEPQNYSSGIRLVVNEKYLFTTAVLNKPVEKENGNFTTIMATEWKKIFQTNISECIESNELLLTEHPLRRIEITDKFLVAVQENNYVSIHDAFSLQNLYLIKLTSNVGKMIIKDKMTYCVFDEFSLLCIKRLSYKSHICNDCLQKFICDYSVKTVTYKWYLCPHYFQ